MDDKNIVCGHYIKKVALVLLSSVKDGERCVGIYIIYSDASFTVDS